MAGENRVQVDLVAENADLKAKLAEAEASIAAMGQRGGKSAAAGIDEATKSAGLLQKALRLVAFPAIAIGTAYRFATAILDATDRVKILREELTSMTKQFTDQAKFGAISLNFSDIVVDTAKINEQARAVTEELQKKLVDAQEAAANAAASKTAFNLTPIGLATPDAVENFILEQFGVGPNSTAKIVAEIKKQIAAVETARATSVANAETARKRALEKANAVVDAQLVNTEVERLSIEHNQRLLEIRRQFNTQAGQETDEATAALLEKYVQLHIKALDKIDAARRRQLNDYIRDLQEAQTSGFGLSAGAPAFAGTGTALQFLTDNIASFARTANGGR